MNFKHVLVVGATKGIGRSVVEKLSKHKTGKITIAGRSNDLLHELKSLYSTSHSTISSIQCDLIDPNEIEKLVNKTTEIDGLVFCVGKVDFMPVKYLSEDYIFENYQVNFFSAVYLIKFLLKQKKIKSNASLVFVSSVASKLPFIGGSIYSSAKAALENFTLAVVMENKKLKLRANSVSPAMVQTDILQEVESSISSEVMKTHLDQYYLGHGKPQDIANLICFLLSDESNWITGENFKMDGGLFLSGK